MTSRRSQYLLLTGLFLICFTGAVFYGPRLYEYLIVSEIVGEGDSLMSNGTALSFLRLKLQESSNSEWRARNLGKGGERVGVEILRSQPDDLPFYHLPWKTQDKVWLLAGTNDIAGPSGKETVDKTLASVETYFKNLHDVGYTREMCFYTDVLPANRTENPTFDQDRRSFNAQISDRLRSLATVIRSSQNPLLQDPSNREYFTDGVHLTTKGYQLLAEDAFSAMTPK